MLLPSQHTCCTTLPAFVVLSYAPSPVITKSDFVISCSKLYSSNIICIPCEKGFNYCVCFNLYICTFFNVAPSAATNPPGRPPELLLVVGSERERNYTPAAPAPGKLETSTPKVSL